MRISQPGAIFTRSKQMCGAKANVNQHGAALHQAIIILNARGQPRFANHDRNVHSVSESLDGADGGGHQRSFGGRIAPACIGAVQDPQLVRSNAQC